jgi:hypothetical protein
MKTYDIIAKYPGRKAEVIDQAADLEEAIYLVNEYFIAFGQKWHIYYK